MTTDMVRGDFSIFAVAGGVALLLGFLVPSVSAEQPSLLADQPTASQAAGLQAGLSGDQIVERVSPSVVLILVGQGGEQATAVGSGVIVKTDGILLTALHLVKGADTVQVRLKNGEIYDRVELIGADERRDIAALHITASGLPAVSVAGTNEVNPGQTVMVVANPMGLSWSASSGVLSAQRLADDIPAAGTGYRLLQFTAPVSPGSSGGVLVNEEGRALGIVIGSRGGQNLNPASGTIVGSGKVIAWDGVRAAPGISSQIIKRLRDLRGTTQSGKKRV